MHKLQSRSALASSAQDTPVCWTAPGLRIEEASGAAVLSMRTFKSSADTAKQIAAALGVALPQQPNTFVAINEVRLAWAAPGHWLALTTLAKRDAILNYDMPGVQVVDMSSAYAIIRLEGEKARAVLSTGCPIDLSSLEDGACAGSLFNEIGIHLQSMSDRGDEYVLACDRPFARALWNGLIDAAQTILW